MYNPAAASWGLSISDSNFAKLEHGLRARIIDDAWATLAMTDEELLEEAAEKETRTEETTGRLLPDEELLNR